jgi:hypothetical protein
MLGVVFGAGRFLIKSFAAAKARLVDQDQG